MLWIRFVIVVSGVVLAASISAQDSSKEKPKSLADEMPRIKATEPKDALKTFEVQQGFKLELVASEPMVSDPVDGCFDENGRMFVAEMRGYPYSQEPTRLNPKGGGKADAGIVRLLEDTDGDGRMDRSVVFADKIRWPTSVCCYDGGVFVLAPPTLWWFKDTTGDGKANIRHRVFDGFNRDNVQAVANNMKWGLDHRIYVAGGRNPSVLTQDGKELLKLGRVDFSFDPLTETVRPETGGVQFGHSFDDWGNRFVCSNSNHIQHVVVPYEYTSRETWSGPPAIKSIAVEGAAAPVFRRSQAEPWRVVRTRRRVADPKFARLPPTEKVPIGFFTSATSVTIYRGDAWPEEYRGQAFIGDVGGNLVHRKILEPDGVSFKARRADQNCEFLASTDNWFRPTNFVNAPDGTLYLLDMYRETIEHPYSIPEDIKAHLDLQSGFDRGRIYRLVAKNGVRKPVEKLGGLSAKELAKRLASKNAWMRETAYRLLWERHDKESIKEEIQALRKSKLSIARFMALLATARLDRRGLTLTRKEAQRVLGDSHPQIRRHVLKLAAEKKIQLSRPEVENDDRVLFEILANFPAWTNLSAERIEKFLFSSDPFVLAAASNAGLGNEMLFQMLHQEKLDLVQLQRIGRTTWFDSTIRNASRETVLSSILVSRFDDIRIPAAIRLRVARLVDSEWEKQNVGRFFGQPRPVGPLALADAEAKLASNDSTEVDRIYATGLLGFGHERHLKVVLKQLSPEYSTAIQSAAVRSAFNFIGVSFKKNPIKLPDVIRQQAEQRQWDDGIVKSVLSYWDEASPAVRKVIVQEFLSSIQGTNRLLVALRRGDIPGREVDAESKKFLLGHASSDVAAQARKTFKPEPTASRKEVLAKYQPALDVAGEVAKGRELFLKKCSICHKVGDQGHLVAPEIVSVVNKSPDDLLIAILDPNREAQPNFTQYTVITKAGKVFNGMIAAETGASLTLRRAEGKQDVIRRADIAELVSSGKSLMPEGFEKDLSPEQIRDIIAFVKSLGVKKK
jgi:putative membrane-bound dehydrogenase-like protein